MAATPLLDDIAAVFPGAVLFPSPCRCGQPAYREPDQWGVWFVTEDGKTICDACILRTPEPKKKKEG